MLHHNDRCIPLMSKTIPIAGAGEASMPLLRQIESMAVQFKSQQAAAFEIESKLQNRARDAEATAEAARAAERAAAGRATAAEAAAAAAQQSALQSGKACSDLKVRLICSL